MKTHARTICNSHMYTYRYMPIHTLYKLTVTLLGYFDISFPKNLLKIRFG